MIRSLALVFALVVSACSQAESVASNSVFDQPAPDPRAHGDQIAARIAESGVATIREEFARIGQTNQQIETALTTIDTAIGGRPPLSWRMIEDVTLSDTVRNIYYLHTYQGTLLFTRLDFVREGGTWYFVGYYFANNWQMVASPTTPGFQPSTPVAAGAAASP
jgi:hypothetical protein